MTNFRITVDYSKSLNELLEGTYISDFERACMTRCFLLTEKGMSDIETEYVLFGGETVSIHEVLHAMKHRGLRPANIAELIAFWKANRNVVGTENRKIAALGSRSVYNELEFPTLAADCDGALTTLCSYHGEYFMRRDEMPSRWFLFLGVRNETEHAP